ncbi:MAG: hypothetical protein NC131_06345 [Roseburia sp.]|nr:hypothetical protein [Roseburia sp.]
MEERTPIVVKGVFSPEAYKEALDNNPISLNPAQKEAVKKLSLALGISGSDIIKALRYYAFDRGIILTIKP